MFRDSPGESTVTAPADFSLETVTRLAPKPVPSNRLILSLFPGIDLFSKPFEALGFCVVRGPDLLLGQDVRDFHVPSGVFAGIIGGSPCQEFSGLRRQEPTGYGLEMLYHYNRIVKEAEPDWWLLENVSRVPDMLVDGYSRQRFELNQAWFSDTSRLRHFQFGSRSGILLNPPYYPGRSAQNGCATASDDRSFEQLKYCQGLPEDFDLPSFNVEGKKRAVGNGVPLVLGQVLADLINFHIYGVTRRPQSDVTDQVNSPVTHRVQNLVTRPGDKAVTARVCLCGCGRVVVGKAKYHNPACRKRASRAKVAA
ncbi:DNA cytosine methyltransferase [Rheinheimera texasensis]|uniref:DNA cytosine methyltransferase n=1 Tax=Rheinheimera texasensis TaxID=306205 RepID=UPI0032B2E2ED